MTIEYIDAAFKDLQEALLKDGADKTESLATWARFYGVDLVRGSRSLKRMSPVGQFIENIDAVREENRRLKEQLSGCRKDLCDCEDQLRLCEDQS